MVNKVVYSVLVSHVTNFTLPPVLTCLEIEKDLSLGLHALGVTRKRLFVLLHYNLRLKLF